MTAAAGDHFPRETLDFLSDITGHNSREWFEANRDRYEAGYLDPARAFVTAIGPDLARISAGVRFEPRINGSISRINRDIRFSADKTPYKNHLDMWFWHGERRGWDTPGFYIRITPETVMLGSGMHAFDKPTLAAFRTAVDDPSAGAALEDAVSAVVGAGKAYRVGGHSRKTVPKGISADHPRAGLLKHEGLYAGLELPAAEASRPGFRERALGHFAATWPIGRWLLEAVIPRRG